MPNDALPATLPGLRHEFAGKAGLVCPATAILAAAAPLAATSTISCHAVVIHAAAATLAAKSTAVANDDAASVWGRLPLLRWLVGLVHRDAYAVGHYRSGKFEYGGPVHAPLSDADLRAHLSGQRPVAVYPIALGSNTTNVGVLDIDNKE